MYLFLNNLKSHLSLTTTSRVNIYQKVFLQSISLLLERNQYRKNLSFAQPCKGIPTFYTCQLETYISVYGGLEKTWSGILCN